MSKQLKQKINLALKLLIDYDESLEYEKIINVFEHNGINKTLGDDIYIFLPIIFCKELLPNLNFPESYYEKNKFGEKKKKFDDSKLYQLIKASAKDYFQNNPDSEVILKIAGLSAEFKVINNLLMNGGKLEDVRLTETVILK